MRYIEERIEKKLMRQFGPLWCYFRRKWLVWLTLGLIASLDLGLASPGGQKRPRVDGSVVLRSSRLKKNCSVAGCSKWPQLEGLCKAHGGSRRCPMAGCGRAVRSQGLCSAHCKKRLCSIPGCSKFPQRWGLCSVHGGRRICSVSDCQKVARAGGVCTAHNIRKRCAEPDCHNLIRKGRWCFAHLHGAVREGCADSPNPQPVEVIDQAEVSPDADTRLILDSLPHPARLDPEEIVGELTRGVEMVMQEDTCPDADTWLILASLPNPASVDVDAVALQFALDEGGVSEDNPW